MPWLLLDVVWLLVFAALGREQHADSSTLVGIGEVAWPFVAGYVITAIVVGLRRAPRSLSRGAIVWLGTIAVAMALRTVLKGGLPPLSFIVVATTFIGVGLLGWRVAALVIARRRARTAEPGTND